MKKFLNILVVVGLALVPAFSYSFDSLLFVRTIRDSATIAKDSVKLKQNDCVVANGVELSCEDREFLSVGLSNGSVIFLRNKSKAKIISATQKAYKNQDCVIITEKAPSEVKIELEYGDFCLIRPKDPRTESSFEVITAYGSIYSVGENMFIKFDPESKKLRFCAAQNFATKFKRIDKTDNPDYIQAGLILNVFEENGKIKTKHEYISEEFNKKLKETLVLLKDAYETSAYKFDENGKPLSAYRAIPCNFQSREKFSLKYLNADKNAYKK